MINKIEFRFMSTYWDTNAMFKQVEFSLLYLYEVQSFRKVINLEVII